MLLFWVVVSGLLAGGIGFWLGGRGGPDTVDSETLSSVGPNQTPSTSDRGASRLDIERALADLRLGVVVIGSGGSSVYRNNRAERYATGRHGDALVEAALQRVIDGALVGLSLEESVEIYGPPARSLLVQASPSYDDGVVSGAVAVIDDVTEARHTDRVRSDFVANVSHELRTPVGAMSVLAETMAHSDDPEVISRLSDRMQREASRLSNTIDDLLALSRLESGPVADPETIDLISVATMAIERTAEVAQQRGVRVELENQAGRSVLVDGDQGQLVSAVANLIDNAIKYSDSGDGVTVQVRAAINPGAPGVESTPEPNGSSSPGPSPSSPSSPYSLSSPYPGSEGDQTAVTAMMAELAVIDSGIGIPERDLDRIFERFYRVDSARRRETGGTGLGLSIVRHALINHGGNIDVESTEGRGSAFTMRLPLSATHFQIPSDHQA